MIRFSTAMVLFGVVALLAWTTLADQHIRDVTLLVLGLFALRSWSHQRRQKQKQRDEEASQAQQPLPGRVEDAGSLSAAKRV
jgi:uncharacterized protein YhhL (DUF1145 family)